MCGAVKGGGPFKLRHGDALTSREIDTSPSIAWRSLIPRFRTASRIAFGDRGAAAQSAVFDPDLNSEKPASKRLTADSERWGFGAY